ncbi:MAG TPA: DUF2807 domain-containing protein [Chryseosolibacter sp.]|nr:DUF2807 domain-containing protein [Chryseosolibacter sp.]
MKHIFFLSAVVLMAIASIAQEIEKDLKSFTKIITSPRVNVVLQKGEKEHIRLVYNNVSKGKINIVVRGNTLHVYLDEAKKIERTERLNDLGSTFTMYHGARLTAYITYKDLELLEIRGNQQLTVLTPIDVEHFVLRAYGENIITINSLNTDFFKASLYGNNKLRINAGKVVEQKYRLYGANKIDSENVKSAYATTNIYGEGSIHLRSTEEVRVNAFGDPYIQVAGGAHINKWLVFGRADIVRR